MFNSVILLTDEMIVTPEVPPGSFKLEQTAKSGKFHVKAPADFFEVGGLVPVAIDVNRRVGTGRRSHLEHVGYTILGCEVTGVGERWHNPKTGFFYQNFYLG